MKCYNSKTNNQAFTLIELLLFFALFSIILGVLTNLFSVIIETQTEVQTTSAVEMDSKFIETRLMHDIQRAERIDTPASAGSQTSTLVLTIDGDSYQYALSSGNLILTTNSGSDTLNSMYTEILAISFQRFGNIGGKHAVRLSMTMVSRNQTAAGQDTKTVETMIGLR